MIHGMPNDAISRLAPLSSFLALSGPERSRRESPPSASAGSALLRAPSACVRRAANGAWRRSTHPLIAGMAVRKRRAGPRLRSDRRPRRSRSPVRPNWKLRSRCHHSPDAVSRAGIGIHLARLGSGESVEIDLPRGGVWLMAPGDYDIIAGTDQTPAGSRCSPARRVSPATAPIARSRPGRRWC